LNQPGVTERAEPSIRLALGAQRGAIRAMVLRRGLTVTRAGIALGLGASAVFSRLMRSMLFQVTPLDPIVFGAAIAFMSVAAAFAAYLPAHRGTSMDPRSALQ
jgi:ABC-type antimicrobial peptide transport system permease subunit